MENEPQIDDLFNQFKLKMGSPIAQVMPSEQQIEFFRGVLPDSLLQIWRTYGWCGLAEGRFWLVNPNEYRDLLEEITKSQEQHYDPKNNFVFARSAFGMLSIWNAQNGAVFEYDPVRNWFVEVQFCEKESLELNFMEYITPQNIQRSDVADSTGKYIFKYALKKLGTLSTNEMYSFPLDLSSADYHWRNVIKADIFTYLVSMKNRNNWSFPFL